MMNWSNIRAVLSGIVFGVLAGATVGYLTAPGSGAHTRKMIKRNLDRSRKRLSTAVYEAGAQVNGTIQDTRQQVVSMVEDTVQHAQKQASKVGRIGKRTVGKEVQSAKSGFNKVRKSMAS